LALDSTEEFSVDSSSQIQGGGKAYAANYATPTPATLTTAVSDMEIAYTDAASRTNANATRINLGAGAIGGLTLTPGIYTFQVDITIMADMYFDGDADDVFIIQTTKTLFQAANKKVILLNGAQAKNIFWQVADHVNVNAGGHMEGILLAKTAVTFKTGSSLNGRVFSQTACVLQMATITEV
jgi:hypothetical protein